MRQKQLIVALGKVQEALKTIVTNADNPFYKSKYATLDHIMTDVKPLLVKNRLVVIQSPVSDGDKVGVETTIFHTSGESIMSKVLFTLAKNDPQGAGSAITYARRYALCGMLGITIANEDDDGNIASTQDAIDTYTKTKPDADMQSHPVCVKCGGDMLGQPLWKKMCAKCFKT